MKGAAFLRYLGVEQDLQEDVGKLTAQLRIRATDGFDNLLRFFQEVWHQTLVRLRLLPATPRPSSRHHFAGLPDRIA